MPYQRFFVLLLCSYLVACSSYHTQPLTPKLTGELVRVSVKDTVGLQPYVSVKVRDFWVRGDHVGGLVCRKEDHARPYCSWEEWAVRRSLVVTVRIKRFDGRKTVLSALSLLAGAWGVALGAQAESLELMIESVGAALHGLADVAETREPKR